MSGETKSELLDRIRREFACTTELVSIAGTPIEFTRVSDPEAVFDGMEDETWQPYWAQAWDSSLPLAIRISQLDLLDQHVLDLGCGLGLVGTVAAARGAQTWMADAAPPALDFARLNSWPWRAHVDFRQLDWNTAALNKKFDWIFGSDLLYDRHDWSGLEEFCRSHLRSNGQVLFTEPGRTTGNEFLQWMPDRGWQVTVTAQPDAGRVRFLQCVPAATEKGTTES